MTVGRQEALPAPPDGVSWQATVRHDQSTITIAYTIHNASAAPIVVFNALPAERHHGAGDRTTDPDRVFVYRDGDTAIIAKRLFTQPENVDFDSPPWLRGTVVAAGQSASEQVRVPRPLTAWHPFDDVTDRQVRSAGAVVFCLGVARTTDIKPQYGTAQDPHPVYTIQSDEHQGMLCTPKHKL